jgi:hypothetical protein
MSVSFGCISYDVPKCRPKSVYGKVRAKFRRKSIMQTWSCYLIPWGLAEELQNALEELNKDSEGHPLPSSQQIRYRVFKYDDNQSGKALKDSALEALQKMIADAKADIGEKMDLLAHLDDPEVDKVGAVRSAKVACKRAQKLKQDIEHLAFIFGMTNDIEAGVLAFQGYLEAKRLEIKNATAGSGTTVQQPVLPSVSNCPI